MGKNLDEQEDYCAFCKCGCGGWVGLMSKGPPMTDADVRKFYKDFAGYDIRVLPLSDIRDDVVRCASELHKDKESS